jgi:hypothetical protein
MFGRRGHCYMNHLKPFPRQGVVYYTILTILLLLSINVFSFLGLLPISIQPANRKVLLVHVGLYLWPRMIRIDNRQLKTY